MTLCARFSFFWETQVSTQDIHSILRKQRIAYISAHWHKNILDHGKRGFVEELRRLGVAEDRVDFFEVVGAFEIPLHAKLLANGGGHAAVVGAALVVDGGIYRHDFVAQAVVSALMQVQLETAVPVFSVVLTPHHFHGNAEHVEFFSQHLFVKGQEAARACVDTLEKLAIVRSRGAAAVEDQPA